MAQVQHDSKNGHASQERFAGCTGTVLLNVAFSYTNALQTKELYELLFYLYSNERIRYPINEPDTIARIDEQVFGPNIIVYDIHLMQKRNALNQVHHNGRDHSIVFCIFGVAQMFQLFGIHHRFVKETRPRDSTIGNVHARLVVFSLFRVWRGKQIHVPKRFQRKQIVSFPSLVLLAHRLPFLFLQHRRGKHTSVRFMQKEVYGG